LDSSQVWTTAKLKFGNAKLKLKEFIMNKVVLYEWQPGFNKVALNKRLRNQAGYSLASAKQAVDNLLDGKTIEIEIDSHQRAEEFLKDALKLKAIGKIITSQQDQQLAEVRKLLAKIIETEAAQLAPTRELEAIQKW
jgi:hypothetical protein